MGPRTDFQSIILNLQSYWAEQGCVILQPYDMEVGAGTFHPATTLRALGQIFTGMPPMRSHRAVQQMAAMAIIQIVCSIIINSKPS